jgi:hypothetical protein
MPAEKAPMRGRLRSSVTAARPWPERMANRHHHRHLLIDGWALPRSAHVKRAQGERIRLVGVLMHATSEETMEGLAANQARAAPLGRR